MSTLFLSRFTPSMMAPEDLEAIFVQREPLAQRLVEQIRESALTPAKHHNLLVGPRGIGKTHLVSLIYHRISALPELRSRLLTAWMREEEWGVTSFLDLLLRILRALADEEGVNIPSQRLDELFEQKPERAEKMAAVLLREIIGDRTLLLLVENLDDLFAGLDEQGQRSFRAFLQEESSVTILATAPGLFRGVSLQTWPFYGFFRVQHLKELSLDEAVDILERIARSRGQHDLATFIKTPIGRARIRAVHHLANGNPRIYVILSEFLTRESLDELVAPFMRMLDDLTPYYQARMAWLSPQQRKIVEFLVDHRSPATVKEIAQRCFITQQTASGQLRKLGGMGYVVSEAAGRESYYELREPLMRLCLEVKKQRQAPVRLFVDFLRVWWTKGELETRLLLLTNQKGVDKEYLVHALETLRKESRDPRVAACEKDYSQYFEKGDFAQALGVAGEMVALRGAAADFENQALCLMCLDRSSEALVAFEMAISLDSSTWTAHYGRATVLLGEARSEEAVVSSNLAVMLNPTSEKVWACHAQILMNLSRMSEALAAWKRVTEINVDNAIGWLNRALLESTLDNIDEEDAATERALALNPDFADAWLMKGFASIRRGSWNLAIDAFEKAHRLGDSLHFSLFLRLLPLAKMERWNELLPTLELAVESLPSVVGAKPLIENLLSTVGDTLMIGAATGSLPKQILVDFLSSCGKIAGLAVPLVWLLRSIAKFSKIKPEDMNIWEQYLSTIQSNEDYGHARRLLNVGLEYRKTGDPKVLLQLPVEERRIFSELFNPTKGSSVDMLKAQRHTGEVPPQRDRPRRK